MARVCEVTGKRPLVGRNVSHANNKTKRRFLPNLHSKRFWSEELNRFVRLRVTSNAMRTIDKKGLDVVLQSLGKLKKKAKKQASEQVKETQDS